MQNNTSASRDDLINDYQRYVRNLAGMLITSMTLPQDLMDDLVSAGLLGLVEAAERFDRRLGNNFKTFAFYRIRGAMIDSIRRASDFSGRAYRAARAFDAYSSLRDEYSNTRDRLKDSDRRRRLQEIFNLASDGALAFRLSIPDEDAAIPIELRVHRNAEQLMIADQDNKKVSMLVDRLPDKEKLIVEEYYINGLSFVQITEKYPELSKSWVSRLHKRALRKLRSGMQDDFMEIPS